MTLLVENMEEKLVPQVAEEMGTDGSVGPKNYFLSGIFLQAELRNGNGRVYPKDVLDEAVQVYRDKYIAMGRGYGELGHPDPTDPGIHLDNICILTQSLEEDGNNYIGKAKVIDTPQGKILKVFIDEGVTLGVSSRGRGEVKNGIIQKGYRLVTAVDVVADPSAPDAFVSALVESQDWVVENGIMIEADVMGLREEVLKAKAKDLREAKIAAFEKFMKRIGIN